MSDDLEEYRLKAARASVSPNTTVATPIPIGMSPSASLRPS
jgi:hypothetical protein